MNQRKKRVIYVSLIILLFFYANSDEISKDMEHDNIEQISSVEIFNEVKLTVSDPIIIINDQDFIYYAFPGQGTEEEPYLIENYTIDTDEEFGIFITNTTKHFKIQYCVVYASVSAISVSDLTVENIEIRNNVCQVEEWYGIYIYSTDYVIITDNWCRGGAVGIVCWYSNNEFIENNECIYNDFGIALYETDNSYIGDNYCHHNSYAGIHIMYSSYINISRNTVYKSGFGIDFISSSFGYITDNFCNNTFWGILAEYSNRAVIDRNLCINSIAGIELWHTGKINVSENECHSCQQGIAVDEDSESQVRNNVCYSNSEYGINIWRGISTSVTNNSLFMNKLSGITIYKGSPNVLLNNCSFNRIGISITGVQSITLSNNTCAMNIKGIVLSETDFSTISYNILQENIEYGIKIGDWSTWNKIHHNYFICNNRNGTVHGFSQAYDEGYNNRWYESSTDEGNYWNDYEGIGEYQIDGKDNNTDPYPFEYYYYCQVTSEPTIVPTEESYFGLLIIVLSVLGTVVVTTKRYRK